MVVKEWIKCLIIAGGWGVFQTLFYLGWADDVFFSDIVLQFCFSRIIFETVHIIDTSLRLLPVLIFQILFGVYIYQHFCSASVYYFSRCSNRILWLLKESWSLYPYALFYSCTMVVTGTWVTMTTNHVIFDKVSWMIFIYYVLIHSLWLFMTSLLINILAIKWNSQGAFMVVAGIELLSIASLLIWENLLPLHIERNANLLKFNPMSHIILSLHSSEFISINERLNDYSLDFNLNESVYIILISLFVVLSIGCYIVKTQDLIVANKETGGGI